MNHKKWLAWILMVILMITIIPTSIQLNAGEAETGEEGSETDPEPSIRIAYHKLTLEKGSEKTLKAHTVPEGGSVVWSTSDSTVATVKNGTIRARNAGTAVITATCGAVSTSCTVRVTIPSTSVDITGRDSFTLGVGMTRTMAATMQPENTTDRVYWSSSDKTIATVAAGGIVKGRKPGSAVITAKTSSGKTDQVTVIVKKAPTSVSLNKSEVTINRLQTFRLKRSIPKGSYATGTWSSSNRTVAVVSQTGVVKTRKAGTAEITYTAYNGKSATCKVTVRPNVRSIQLSSKETSLKIGSSIRLEATYNPSNSYEILNWKSSDTSVATVSSKGKVTAKSEGTCTITATTKRTGRVATCTIHVYKNLKQVAITFDDGPKRSTTTRLLDGLKSRGVKATFFLIGCQVPDCADLVKRMKNEGHEIGNHTYNHTYLNRVSLSEAATEISRCTTVIRNACGSNPTLFRSPGGNYNDQILQLAGLPHIYWEVDTRDWESRNEAAVYSQIMAGAKDGAIILCHDIYDTTVSAALRAITDLQKQGYQFVTVTELMTRDGRAFPAGKNYYGLNR